MQIANVDWTTVNILDTPIVFKCHFKVNHYILLYVIHSKMYVLECFALTSYYRSKQGDVFSVTLSSTEPGRIGCVICRYSAAMSFLLWSAVNDHKALYNTQCYK